MISPETALEQLNRSAETADNGPVTGILTELQSSLRQDAHWPEDFFEGVMALMVNESFLELPDSWHVVNLVRMNWDGIAREQREKLRAPLAASFDLYANRMGAFVTTEIFGEMYADEQALSVLKELAETAGMPARAFVPHGLEYFAKSCQNEALRQSALGELKRLTRSPIAEVKEEAELSLGKFGLSAAG